MASGDTLFVLPGMPVGGAPSSDSADLAFITGAASPSEILPVLAFDAAASPPECWDFRVHLPAHYDDGGLTLDLEVGSASVAGGATAAVWRAAIRRIADDAEDLDTTAHSYDFNSVTVTPPSAIGETKKASITFSAGADMDSLAVDEPFILRVQRLATATGDDMTGDAYLHSIHCKET